MRQTKTRARLRRGIAARYACCLTFESVNPAEQDARSIAPRARERLAAQRDEGEFLYQ